MPIPENDGGLDRRLLREDVFGRLRDAIVDCTFAPGEQLRDGELAAWLGVSRTPVREALLRLGEAGLVVASPGKSTIVSPIDVRAVRDARDVVAALHGVAVREAVGHLTEADLEAMRDAAQRFEVALNEGDVDAALKADDDLHGIPVRAAGNRALAAVLNQFTPVIRRAERLRFSSEEGQASLARHEELLRLCEAGDAEAASAIAFNTFHSLPAGDSE